MANEVVKKDFQSVMLRNVVEQATVSGCQLTNSEMNYAQEIVLSTLKKLKEDGTDPQKVNFMGCNFPGQVKRFCRLGLDLNENEIFLDIHNNKGTGLKDINIKMQYQGEKKLLLKYCQKGGGIVHFVDDVIMNGDKFVTGRDFKTGQSVIKEHDFGDMLNRNVTWGNKDNVVGAYAIAYHRDGTQTVVVIDKDRINRAIEASTSIEKTTYKKDFRKMVIKTAYHELFKALKVHNVIPDDLLKDYTDIQLSSNEVKSEIRQNANTEYFDAEVTEKKEPEKIAAQSETLQKAPRFDEKTGEVLDPVNFSKTAQKQENSTVLPQSDGYVW